MRTGPWVLAAAVSLGGCAAGTQLAATEASEAQDPALMVECLVEPGEVRFIGIEAERALPGATLDLSAMQGAPWAGPEPAAAPCVRGWALSEAAPARLSSDGNSVTIADDAPPGARFSVTAEIGGETVSREIVVADPAVAVISLRARQRAIDRCQRTPIGEFVLDHERRFEVTFNPFERYVDYWGTYVYDPASTRLTLTVTGGNAVPPGLDLDGTIERAAEGGWRLDGFDFGGGNEPAQSNGCLYQF